MKFITVLPGCVAAALTLVACNDNSTPGGPDFGRDLAPGEYQVSVTGDVQRSFESTGATYQEFATPPSDFDRAFLSIWDNTDALNGADFYLCVMAVEGASYRFDAATPFTACPSDPGRAWGGFIVQLGAPQADELDCYPNSYGDKAFEGVLIIASVTASDVQGEANGTGTCSRHPHSEIEPMQSAAVSVRVRFRAVKESS